MGRKAIPINVMKRAARAKDVEELLWACILHAIDEIKENQEQKTFSGRDINAFISTIIKLEKSGDNSVNEDETDKRKEEIAKWLSNPPKGRDL